jgi:hypothetical protein
MAQAQTDRFGTTLDDLGMAPGRPPRSLSVAYVQHLVDSGAVDASWTIQEVVDRFVRPATREFKCCLFDMVPERWTGQPTYFVSTHTSGQRSQVECRKHSRRIQA